MPAASLAAHFLPCLFSLAHKKILQNVKSKINKNLSSFRSVCHVADASESSATSRRSMDAL